MNDFIDRRSPNRVRAQLEAARTAGAWMPWAGAALAALLWGGIGVWLVASLGIDGLMKQSPLVMAGGFAAVLSTGLALICAGIMAREGARSAEANQIVLTSARLLLEPAEPPLILRAPTLRAAETCLEREAEKPDAGS